MVTSYKGIVIMQLWFSLSLPIYSFEFGNNFSLGVLGFGVSPKNGSAGWYTWGHVGNFTYQSEYGFGVNISPLNFFTNNEDSDSFFLTFVNTSFFYNIFRDEHFILGPVASVNAIDYKHPGFFEVHGGIRFSMRNLNFWDPGFYKDNILGFDCLIVELGYRYNNKNGHGFYTFIGADLLTGVYYLAAIASDADPKKYQEEYPAY
jgi:hypothetical protein